MKNHRKRTKKCFVLSALSMIPAARISYFFLTSLLVAFSSSKMYIQLSVQRTIVVSVFMIEYGQNEKLILQVDTRKGVRNYCWVQGIGLIISLTMNTVLKYLLIINVLVVICSMQWLSN